MAGRVALRPWIGHAVDMRTTPRAPTPAALPPLPLDSWRPTKDTLHLFAQILGKVRMACAPPRNHWWHVTLRVSPRGITTRMIPHPTQPFEIELDLVGHGVEVRTADGDHDRLPLRDGLSVAAFYGWLMPRLRAFGIEPQILARPYDVAFASGPFAEDVRHAAYDPAAASRFASILRWTCSVFEEFAGRFTGKTSPVQFFWHAFDLAVTRFSGRRAPELPDADPVERQAYSHEVASFGFWPGDDQVPAPACYAYAAPVPEGLRGEPLQPAAAKWNPEGGMALLMYDEVRKAADPRAALLAFCDSVYTAAAKRGRWPDAATP
jgi:hypothetical protein